MRVIGSVPFFLGYFHDVYRKSRKARPRLPRMLSHRLRFVMFVLQAERRRRRMERSLGHPIPRFCLFSVTWRCNLHCAGCYASNYSLKDELSPEEVRRVIAEACELGTFFYIIVGGEPLMVPGVIDILAQEKRGFFFLFTNGTELRAADVEKIIEAGNILPVVSFEGEDNLTERRRGTGVENQALAAMELLRAAGMPFAFSAMVTRQNLDVVTSSEWMTDMWNRGACFGFFIDYIPMPSTLEPSYVLTPEDKAHKRAAFEERHRDTRMLFLSFPDDEYSLFGCQSAGVGMMHINANGFVEPCPFSHYACDNVREKSLSSILRSPFFQRLRSRFAGKPSSDGQCLLFLNDDEVREIAGATGAVRTEESDGVN